MDKFIEVMDQKTKMGCLINVSNILFIAATEERNEECLLTVIKLINGDSIYVDNRFEEMVERLSEQLLY